MPANDILRFLDNPKIEVLGLALGGGVVESVLCTVLAAFDQCPFVSGMFLCTIFENSSGLVVFVWFQGVFFLQMFIFSSFSCILYNVILSDGVCLSIFGTKSDNRRDYGLIFLHVNK